MYFKKEKEKKKKNKNKKRRKEKKSKRRKKRIGSQRGGEYSFESSLMKASN
jgi:hypothetical protein